MEYGLAFFPTDRSMDPGSFAEAAEQRGFESVWYAEHSHIPVSPETPGPPEEGQPGLEREYYAVADPFVSLALAAARTSKIKLGTGICLAAQRDVFQTAKQVASLDLYSGGRFQFGVGGGWIQAEVKNHGTPYNKRFAILRERVEAMKQLWTEERAEYHGEYVDFGPAFAWPKPLQKPHPPILVGGNGLRAIRRAVRYGDGWIPLIGEDAGENDPIEQLPALREALSEADRDPEAFTVTIYFDTPDPDTVERCRKAGVSRVVFSVPSLDRDGAVPVMDQYRKYLV
jgi:probable F420-dependent oxidoreductase